MGSGEGRTGPEAPGGEVAAGEATFRMAGRRVALPRGLGRMASEGAANWDATWRVWGLLGAQTVVDSVHGTPAVCGAAADPEQIGER